MRKWVHAACPEATETIKWGQPHFEYKGIFAGMGSFKTHAVSGFWKGELIYGKTAAEQEAMGQFGRMTSVEDLPSGKQFAKLVKQAMRLNDEANLNVLDRAFAAEQTRIFAGDRAQSIEITPENLRSRTLSSAPLQLVQTPLESQL